MNILPRQAREKRFYSPSLGTESGSLCHSPLPTYVQRNGNGRFRLNSLMKTDHLPRQGFARQDKALHKTWFFPHHMTTTSLLDGGATPTTPCCWLTTLLTLSVSFQTNAGGTLVGYIAPFGDSLIAPIPFSSRIGMRDRLTPGTSRSGNVILRFTPK